MLGALMRKAVGLDWPRPASDGQAPAIARRLALWLAPAIYLIGCLALVAAIGAPFVFPLDDSYIHLALARTLATTGVWGVTPANPAAASSSPLWSLFLAAVYAVAPHGLRDHFELAALALNIAAGLAAIRLWRLMLGDIAGREGWIIALVLLTPLSALSLLGMEHVLHLVLASLLAFAASRTIVRDAPAAPVELAGLGALAALAVACRYESLFLVAPLAVAALCYRRPAVSLAIVAGAALPVAGFGALWMRAGGFLLPNALLIKGASPADARGFAAMIGQISLNFADNLVVVAAALAVLTLAGLCLVLALTTIARGWRRDHSVVLGLCAVAATLLQVSLASLGGLYRYEAWIVALDLVAVIRLVTAAGLAGRRLALVVFALLALALEPRAIDDLHKTPMASDDRRLEHIAPARFLHAAYRGNAVVVNDLGAVAYFSDAHPLDMFGLGNNEPVRFRRRPGAYNAAALKNWAAQNHAEIAVLQVCWPGLSELFPPDWRLTALWRVPRNVVSGDRWIGFFAIAPGEKARLRAALQRFAAPAGVEARYLPASLSHEALLQLCSSG